MLISVAKHKKKQRGNWHALRNTSKISSLWILSNQIKLNRNDNQEQTTIIKNTKSLSQLSSNIGHDVEQKQDNLGAENLGQYNT